MFAAFLSVLALAGGQTPPAEQVPPPPEAATAAGDPDILISINAHADRVRWRQVGTVTVRAWSEPGGRIVDENLSTGLPRPIPGQRTFRDVTWTLRAGACFAAPAASDPAAPAVPAASAATDTRCPTPQTPAGDPRP